MEERQREEWTGPESSFTIPDFRSGFRGDTPPGSLVDREGRFGVSGEEGFTNSETEASVLVGWDVSVSLYGVRVPCVFVLHPVPPPW